MGFLEHTHTHYLELLELWFYCMSLIVILDDLDYEYVV